MRLSIILFLMLFSSVAASQVTSAEKEMLYLRYLQQFQSGEYKEFFSLDQDEQKMMIDALWDAQEAGVDVDIFLIELNSSLFTLAEQLRLAVINHRADRSTDTEHLESAIMLAMANDVNLALLVVSLQVDLQAMGLDSLVAQARRFFPVPTTWVAASERPVGDQTAQARAVWDHQTTRSEGELDFFNTNAIRLYLFCRTNRLYTCLMTARDSQQNPVLNSRGELWTHPALASASRGLPSYQRNGNTPSGVMTIDGVMPDPDQPIAFGQFRRLILNFIPKSHDEWLTKKLLPGVAHPTDWWKSASVARDVGRDLLRIHGTGKINEDPTSTWFPFMRTSGCIAQRENTYNGIEYRDQRHLLDVLMQAQGLELSYANEAKLRGVLYVIDLDDQDRAVTPADLRAAGIQ